MEQAVNQFSKGLQMDTHPMVQGNDTLSDALNATFVTMNGNEVVLQNDMGNRRVDNAFLPSGYEPVGIKEYGGVIYIASYNPITNRCQIGSFPSPERKIDSLDDKDLKTDFNFFNHFSEDCDIDENQIRFIKRDSVLLQLSGDTSIHAGDKFAIYSDNNFISQGMLYLSNFYNTNNVSNNSNVKKKVKKLKNNYLTLSVGVLNSQNQFVDITKTLKRWKNNEQQKYDTSYSEDYIFNDGYFISGSSIQDDSQYTHNDRQLILNRQIVESNTYSYKLVGPLYLKLQLNHIQNFSFNIVGDKNSDDSVNLIITATILYNCPDTAISDGGNDQYEDLGCGNIVDWEPFDFYVKEQRVIGRPNEIETPEGGGIYTKKSLTWDWSQKPTYNNGLYTVTTTATLSNYYIADNEINYFIGVSAGIPDYNQTRYIKSMSTYGQLDKSKFNSGEINLKSFRFFNGDAGTTITYSLECYPKTTQTFDGLVLQLDDIETEDQIFIPDEYGESLFPLNNGKTTLSFNWNDYQIEPKKLYKVSFMYRYSENGQATTFDFITKESDRTSYDKRWLLTTKLFNDCYSPQSRYFVEDYGEKVDSNSDSKLYDKLKIKLQLNKISDESYIENPTNQTITGKMIDKYDSNDQNKVLKYMITEEYKVNESISNKITIKNKELFPDIIKLENDEVTINGSPTIDFTNTNFEVNHNGSIEQASIESNIPTIRYNVSNSEKLVDCEIDSNVVNNKTKFNINVKCNSIIFSQSDQNKYIKNGFAKIRSEHFRNTVLTEGVSHSGFFVGQYFRDSIRPNDHYYGLILNNNSLSKPMKDEDDFNQLDSSQVWEWPRRGNVIADFGDSKISEMYNKMSTIDSRYTFAYIFSAINIVGSLNEKSGARLAYVENEYAEAKAGMRPIFTNEDSGRDRTSKTVEARKGFCPITCCKVWWRNGAGDNWILLNPTDGVFGKNELEDMFPETRMSNDNKYIYIGNSEWMYNGASDQYTATAQANIYYKAIYEGKNQQNQEIRNITIDGNDYRCGVNKMIQDQIMEFIDPFDCVVYNLYKSQKSMSEIGLCSISNSNYMYSLPYSGNITLTVSFNTANNISIAGNDGDPDNPITTMLNILEFHIDNSVEGLSEGHKIKIPIKSDIRFEDKIVNVLEQNVISNIYIENGDTLDVNGYDLSDSTIYKDQEGKLVPISNPPFKVYVDDSIDYNSIVCIDSDLAANDTQGSKTRCLRAFGIDSGSDDITLEFTGGELRTANRYKFYNIS